MVLYDAALGEAVPQVGQIVGALLILVPFVGSLLGRLPNGSRRYLVLNLLGSSALATVAIVEGQYGFILLQGVWAIVSAASLLGMRRSS
jgi:hypothetical protein